MAIQSREEWKRQAVAALDAFCAGRRNGMRSRRSDDQAGTLPESQGRANVSSVPPGIEGHLKVYPDLAAAALRQRLDLPYRLWLLARASHNGRGWLVKTDIYNLSTGSRRQTRSWLAQGMDTFWTRNGDRYHLKGLERCSKALGVIPDKNAAYVPMDDVEDLGKFRAMMYATWFTTPATISQTRLATIFGRKPKTLQRWAKIAKLEVGPNLAWTPLPDEVDLKERAAEVKAKYYWTERWDGPPSKRRKRGDKPDDLTALVWIQPNTYRAILPRAPKTRLQRHACQALFKLDSTLRATGQRIYCTRGPGQGRRAARMLEAGGIALVEEARQHHGYGLWEYQA